VEPTQPLWGPAGAPVTLTLFGNLECPHTVAMLGVVLAEKARRGDDLRLAFRYAPLGQHGVGERAARALLAAHAAHGVGPFWTALEKVARRGEPVSPDTLASLIDPTPAELGPRASEALEDDAVLAARLFVRATPVTFVNGVRLDGYQSQRSLAEVIARERRSAGLALANGVGPRELYTARTRRNLLNLGEDPPERACVPAGGSPARGPAGALVTIVEFSEHECELCRKGDTAVSAVLSARPREVRSVWKSRPLPQHSMALAASRLAFGARKLRGDSAFWALTAALLAETELDEAAFARAAESAGLDLAHLTVEAENPLHEAALRRDLDLARDLDVSAVPTYFVNGRRVDGVLPVGELRALVDREIALARRVRKNGAGSVAELACGARAIRLE